MNLDRCIIYWVNRFAVKKLKSCHFCKTIQYTCHLRVSDPTYATHFQFEWLESIISITNTHLCHTEVLCIRGQIAGGLAGSLGVLDKGKTWLSHSTAIFGSEIRLLSSDLLPPDGSRHWLWFPPSENTLCTLPSLPPTPYFHLFSSHPEKYIKPNLPFIFSTLPNKVRIIILLFFNLDIQLLAPCDAFISNLLHWLSFLAKTPQCVWRPRGCVSACTHMLDAWEMSRRTAQQGPFDSAQQRPAASLYINWGFWAINLDEYIQGPTSPLLSNSNRVWTSTLSRLIHDFPPLFSPQYL